MRYITRVGDVTQAGVHHASFCSVAAGPRVESLGAVASREESPLATALRRVTPRCGRCDETWSALGDEVKVAGAANATNNQ